MADLVRVAAWGVCALVVCVLSLLPLKARAYGLLSPGSSVVVSASGLPACGTAARAAWEPVGKCQIAASNSTSAGNIGSCEITSENSASLGFRCVFTPNGNWLSNGSLQKSSVQSCPADSTPSGGQCVCNSGFKPGASGCEPVNCQAVVDAARNVYYEWAGNTATFCLGGCKVTAGVRGYLAATNKSSGEGSSFYTDSESCQGAGAGANGDGNDPGTTPNPGPAPCPVRQCPGTVNGAAVCVPCSTAGAEGPSSSASSPGGAASAPPLPNAPPGATTSTSGTECGLGKCTTTTTYRDANGNKVGETKTEDTEDGYCAKNPGVALCKKPDPSSISGQCDAVTCTGDAIQCAIAREQAKRACEFFAPTGAAVDAGNAGASGIARPGGHPGGSQEVYSFSGMISQANLLPGGCPVDVPLTIGDTNVVMKLSELCSPLQMLGGVLVGLSMFAAVFIVFRG